MTNRGTVRCSRSWLHGICLLVRKTVAVVGVAWRPIVSRQAEQLGDGSFYTVMNLALVSLSADRRLTAQKGSVVLVHVEEKIRLPDWIFLLRPHLIPTPCTKNLKLTEGPVLGRRAPN